MWASDNVVGFSQDLICHGLEVKDTLVRGLSGRVAYRTSSSDKGSSMWSMDCYVFCVWHFVFCLCLPISFVAICRCVAKFPPVACRSGRVPAAMAARAKQEWNLGPPIPVKCIWVAAALGLSWISLVAVSILTGLSKNSLQMTESGRMNACVSAMMIELGSILAFQQLLIVSSDRNLLSTVANKIAGTVT